MNTGAAFAPVSEPSEKPKRAKRISNTQLSLDHLRDSGHTAQVVEHWVPRARVRRDLFGCIDIVAIMDCKIVGVQCGSRGGHSEHKKKCLAEPRVLEWIQAGARFLILSWDQPGGKGKSWRLKSEELTLNDFIKTAELDLL